MTANPLIPEEHLDPLTRAQLDTLCSPDGIEFARFVSMQMGWGSGEDGLRRVLLAAFELAQYFQSINHTREGRA